MGAENTYGITILLLVLLLFPAVVSAQDYSYTMREDGTPVFEQTISWREITQAFAYELIVQDLEGNEIFRKKTDKTSVTVRLSPGKYRYSLVVYNLLDKPEIRSDWQTMEVVKAEIPKILSVSPSVLYLEEGKFLLTLKGENLLDDAEYEILDQKTGKPAIAVEEVSRNDKGDMVLRLSEKKIGPGNYQVRIIDPGGLADVFQSGFRIRFQKPVEISLTVGYAPAIVLMDDWVRETWSKKMYWEGFLARADLFVIKKPWGYIGPALDSHFLIMKGGTTEATINSMIAKGGMDLVYKLMITHSFQVEARAGGGISYSVNKFDYQGTAGSEIDSLDPYFSGGISFYWSFNKRLFMGTGAEFLCTFHNSYNEGILMPVVTFGYKY